MLKIRHMSLDSSKTYSYKMIRKVVRMMEKELFNIANDEDLTIDSREVAAMLGKEHGYVLEMIQGREGKLGIMPVLENANLAVSEYFIESVYKTEGNNKSYKCYLCTKMGCEMLGNKLQGEKGILFTAKYVQRFNKMESIIKDRQIESANNEIKELKETLADFKRATEEAKRQFHPCHKRKLDYNKMIKNIVGDNSDYVEGVKDMVFAQLH
ncbi:Rha family transcriptional regulator [Clostridium beijerinckii]|uniref:Rha family transcriptional regulator n=1 Tax=Clostridium beijerinckii TaxID=1520 RepID=UPI001360FD79|nr:Rha family transcriptional regulator [Clostridium beijerinckii]MZK53465.1 Rha family transcriptional regulator [Clostridium beijerinckii]MZK61603.1 Rha family transcriptional regulator [Clostridium beijerinckii]MZK71828.1 Rha family transcriptional regulator [Clostridium beijerinckii]MZK77232.1 Rha family transcriptional regulator [Clostridium beijerinckii]MZK86311.1 Rha family transcriptional regulator [Clostridium beijerinckii]